MVFFYFCFFIPSSTMKKSVLLVCFCAFLSLGFGQSRGTSSYQKSVDLIDLSEISIDWESAEFVALEERFQKQNSNFKFWIEHNYKAKHYQQDSLMLIDPKGDAHLIRKLDTIPLKLLRILFNGALPQTIDDKEQPEEFEIGKTVPIDVDRLLNKCRDIMLQHYPTIIPILGEEHEWSPDAKVYLYYGFWHRLGRHISGKQQDFPSPFVVGSKLFLCLACGWTARYCVTGQEKALTDRIMEYPDRGIQLHDLFEESYVINKGNLYLTFLTCENVLAGQPHRIGRQNDPLQKKLAYIRHDSKEQGDNYGAWYHLFGIALYGMVRTDFGSRTVAEIESLGSFFYEGADKQETYINRYGAVFGNQFRKMIEHETWKVPLQPAERTDYMIPKPDQIQEKAENGYEKE